MKLALTAALLVTFAVGAASASASLPAPIRGVVYGPVEHENLTVFPCAGPPCEAVDFVHEGGWHEGNFEGTTAPAEDQMERLQAAGLTVFDANYPLDNGERRSAFPLETRAIETLVSWTVGNAAQYGGNPGNITLMGASAGGELALWAGEHEPAVQAIVSLSGPTSFVPLMAESEAGTYAGAGALAHALGCVILDAWAGCTEAHEEEWSPVDHVPEAFPPTYLSGSELDRVPFYQQREMAAAIRQAGGSVQLREILASACHAIVCFPAVRGEVIPFLKAH